MKWMKRHLMMQLGPMMAPKDPDDDGGGGGGAGKPFTPEQEQALGRMVNSALTSHMGRKPFKDAIAAAVGEHTSPILAKLEEMSGGGGGGNDDDGGSNAGGGGGNNRGGGGGGANFKLPPEVQKRLDDLERTNKRLQAEGEQAKTESQKQKRANEVAEEKKLLRDSLKAAGVSDERLDGAMALLYHEQGKLMRDPDGRVRYKLAREGYVDEVDVSSGIAEWIKSPEGKGYLPPVQVQGGGSRGGNNGGARGSKQEPSDQDLLGELGNLLNGGKPTIDLG